MLPHIKSCILILFLFCYCSISLNAQYFPHHDSLRQVLKTEKEEYALLSAHFELANDFFYNGMLEKGLYFYAEMEKFVQTSSIKSAPSCLLILDSYKAFYCENNIEKAVENGLVGIQQLEEIGDDSDLIQDILAVALIEMGYYFEYSGIYHKAMSYYLEGKNIAEAKGLMLSQIMVYNSLSFLHSEYFDDNEMGFEYLEKAIKVAEKINDKEFIAMTNGNFAALYIKLGDLKQGSFYLEKSIALRAAIKDTLGLSHGYLEQAKLFLQANDLKKADESIQKCFDFAPPICDWCYKAYMTKAAIAKKMGRKSDVEQNYLAAKAIVDKIQDISGSYYVLTELGRWAKENNLDSRAANYYAEAFALKDTLDKKLHLKKLLETQIQAKLKVIENEKNVLIFDKKLLSVRVKAQKKSILLTTLLFLITLISAIYIYFQKNKLLASYQLLVKKNRALTQSIQNKKRSQINPKDVNTNEPPQNLEKAEEVILTEAELELLEKIQTLLEIDKIFLDNKLTLASFSQELNTNTSYLSKIINTHYNKRFSALINEYRIKEVLLYFETNQLEELTIFALAQKAGFNSKSAFNIAFKEYTGVTPSFYLKTM